MENKPEIQFTYKGTEVDKDEVWGGPKRIVEIEGLGSGRGFKLNNINLPRDWDESKDKLKNFDLKRFETLNQEICEKWGFELERIVFDPSKILKEISVKNPKTDLVSKMALSDMWLARKGDYVTDNLESVEPTMIFQEVAASYFNCVWGDKFSYGSIYCDTKSKLGGGYNPLWLEVPQDIYESDGILVGEHYQEELIHEAFNISGRFGLKIKDIDFDDRGLLTYVAVDGDRTCYYLENAGISSRRYQGHNIDTPYQALAMHNIVASYINFLLDKRDR